MSSTRVLALGSSVAVALLCGCLGAGPTANGTPSPTPAESLEISLLGAGGPYSAGPPELVAGRSEPELDALLQSVASSFHQPDPWDGSASVGDHVYVGLATRFCGVLNSVSAQLTSPALVIAAGDNPARLRSDSCCVAPRPFRHRQARRSGIG